MAEEDIIFGKHRHLFGGIEPSNMRKFHVEYDGYSKRFRIDAELPKDTVVDGQTLCSVAGAVIRRKTTGYPKDEFDGELVETIYNDAHFLDNTASKNDNIYYYAAFPFSKQGVYNRNEANFTTANDLPDMMTDNNTAGFTAYLGGSGASNSGVYLWGYCGYFDDSWVGFKIMRRSDRYPENENDGSVVLEGTLQTYGYVNKTDYNASSSETNYYAIFPYRLDSSGNKIYSYNLKNRFEPIYARFDADSLLACKYIYGFDLDTRDPNPNTRITYPDDVDNTNFKPAKMDYENNVFDYGDWPSESGASRPSFMPTPYMVHYDSTSNFALDPNDYLLTADGDDSGISDTSQTGNAMMRWPKIYTYRSYDENSGIYKFRCSDVQHSDDWKCWTNYNTSGSVISYFYTAIYPGCTDSGSRLRSLSGQTVKTAISPSQAVDYADNNGTAWYIDTLADRLLIQDLLVLMAKTTDCQKAYGKGICGSSTADTTTGDMNQYGLFWGSQDPTKGVKVFGMENWWGNHERYLAGAISISGSLYVKITRSTKDGSTATDYNMTGSGYVSKGKAMAIAGNIKEMNCYNFGRLPYSSGGSSTTYECDTARIDTSGTYYAMVGGNSKLSEHEVGPFQLRFMYSPTGSTTSTERVAALSYKG